MSVIKVWCLPKLEEEQLKDLFDRIVQAVVSVEELGVLGEGSMTVLFPQDHMAYGLGTDIVIEVTLFKKAPRTYRVRRRLAENLGKAVEGFLPSARKIECLVHSFDPSTDGAHWTSLE